MMSPSVRADLTDLLAYLGCELNDSEADLRPTVMHAIAELARLLSEELDEEEFRSLLASTPASGPPQSPAASSETATASDQLGRAEVLAVRENGTLLKIRDDRGIRHVQRSSHGWVEL
ncbi:MULTISPECIES: hypothetical protein [unclassified Nonomuraea]|uniref:hypothetical protein n=1 Tax=unclassified Nonomuraea TaxID=2593643 RepID=UPI0033F496CD